MIDDGSANFTVRGHLAKGIITKNLQFKSSKYGQVAEADWNVIGILVLNFS
jgi:hypothetical protein